MTAFLSPLVPGFWPSMGEVGSRHTVRLWRAILDSPHTLKQELLAYGKAKKLLRCASVFNHKPWLKLTCHNCFEFS